MSPLTELIGSAKAYGWGSFAAVGAFQSIASVTVDASTASSITFSSIPNTFTHLQIRATYKFGGNGGTPRFRVGNGGVDTGQNYAHSQFQGSGASVTASQYTNGDFIYLGLGYERTDRQAMIMDILDYANTNKFKTFRFQLGYAGASGVFSMNYGQWRSTSAIDTIQLSVQVNNFSQYSHVALYGIKGA